MRGKVLVRVSTHASAGITPAYAGKSRISGTACEACRDHPRLCGEKMPTQRSVEMWLGSPPPMRGKVIVDPVAETTSGITPAYAGKRCTFVYLHKTN